MRYKFIINRKSGRGLKPSFLEQMKERFHRELGHFDHSMPETALEAESIARDCLSQGVDRIVAVGGDGTMNSAANGFFTHEGPAHNGSALMVSNMGAGSDYYSSVTWGGKPRSWMDMVTNHVKRRVDVGMITFHSGPAPARKYFLNMASVGMIADIVVRKEAAGQWAPNSLKYFIPTIKSLFNFAPVRLRVKTDSEDFEVDALTISISKGKYAGKGMRFGLDVELDDGIFEVTIFENSGPARMALKLWRMYAGNYLGVEGIRKLWTNRLELTSEKPVACELDGELYGSTDLTVEVLPREIYVCFPSAGDSRQKAPA